MSKSTKKFWFHEFFFFSLIAQERSGSTSKALNLISVSEFAFDEEPEVYELDIIQPPTR